jgi:hypothetical protein
MVDGPAKARGDDGSTLLRRNRLAYRANISMAYVTAGDTSKFRASNRATRRSLTGLR